MLEIQKTEEIRGRTPTEVAEYLKDRTPELNLVLKQDEYQGHPEFFMVDEDKEFTYIQIIEMFDTQGGYKATLHSLEYVEE